MIMITVLRNDTCLLKISINTISFHVIRHKSGNLQFRERSYKPTIIIFTFEGNGEKTEAPQLPQIFPRHIFMSLTKENVP